MAKYSGGDEVRDRRNGEIGVVLKTERAAQTVLYRIQFGTQSRYVSEGHLEPAIQDPLDALRARELGDPAAFHLRVRALLLEHAYRTDRYSGLTNARIELKPHQVAVATRVLDKVRPRMLLADEVGLGKTIEAGLIIKELFARQVIERVLIITPASLVHQWQYELQNKFNEAFTIVNSATLKHSRQQGIKNPFAEHGKVLCSSHFARTGAAAEQLRDTDWGLVVVDEAHHLAPRPDPNKLYRLAEALAPRAFGMLLLTATPIQLRAKELYDLIELVEPGTFRDAEEFERRRTEIPRLNALWKALEDWPALAPSEQVKAADEYRAQRRGRGLPRSSGALRAAFTSDRRRQEVQRDLAARHPYLDVMIRNRRRVLNIGVRREATLVRCEPSRFEAEIYEEVIEYLRDQYDLAKGAKNNARGFLMVTYLKILSSSTTALAQSFDRRVRRLTAAGGRSKGRAVDVEALRDVEEPSEAVEELDAAVAPATQEIQILQGLIQRLNLVEDVKVEYLLELLEEVFHASPHEKVLIFTQFLGTQDLLRRELREHYRVHVFNGRMSVEEKDHAVESFRERGQILISTESGGEGRNFQFCHLLVNYDLPWNPMRVEQRIGRLDRIGQRHASITIWNLVAEGTVEERVETVLRERIKVFEESIGELDPILEAELEGDLEKAAFAPPDRRDGDFQVVGAQAERQLLEARRTEQQLEDFISDQELKFRRDESARVLQGRERGLLPQLREVISAHLDTIGGSLDAHAEGGDVIALSPLTAQRLGRVSQRRARGTFDAEEAIRLEEVDLFAFGHPMIDHLLRDATALRDDRLAIAYETDGDVPFEGVEVWYRLRVTRAGDQKWLADKHVVAHAVPGRTATVTTLNALDQRRWRPADPDSFSILDDSEALDEAISACQAAALQALQEFESRQREASQHRVERELERERRIHTNRRAAAEHSLARAQEQRDEIERSVDTRAQRILPALRGQVEAGQQRIRDLETEHRHTVEELRHRGEVVTDHEVLGAALARVVPR